MVNQKELVRYYMGVDVARTGRDETVFTVIKLMMMIVYL
jgi:hypothetical protein